jgi:hypothetical protein
MFSAIHFLPCFHHGGMKFLAALACCILSGLLVNAQDNYADAYVCTKGKIHFYSGTAMEDIEAASTDALCVFNTKSKKMYAKVKQTSFVFKDKLMQEHFNENYMESERYPFGILDMTLVEDLDFTRDGSYDVTLKGTLEMHGVKKEMEIKGKMLVKNGQPTEGTALFMVKLADHKIKIPSIVGANIAETVKVDVTFNFEKYKK